LTVALGVAVDLAVHVDAPRADPKPVAQGEHDDLPPDENVFTGHLTQELTFAEKSEL
jgi:hypothetical protein